MTSPAAVLALCRFGEAAAASLLWGASAYLWIVVPRGLDTAVASRLRHAAMATTAVAALAIMAKLPAEVANIGEGWPDALRFAVFEDVLIASSVGQAWLAQAACAVLAVVALAFPPRIGTRAVATASGLLLAALSLEGHAAMHEGWLGTLTRLNDIVHVLSGGAWLGSLAPFLVILRGTRDGDGGADAAAALRGFSRTGHAAVALVLLSGALGTALVLGRWPVDLASPYQGMLDAKILCVLLMTGLAIVNRYVVVLAMARDPERAHRALRFGTLAEIPLGLAAIALVAVFGMLDPA